MIRLYCRRKEKNAVLCEDSRELLTYTHKRLDLCRYGNKKGGLQKVPDSLLRFCFSGKDTGGHEIFRSAIDPALSVGSHPAHFYQ